MPRVIHFEIPADDPQRAVKFYGDLFGWKMEKWGGPMDYWLANTGDSGPGINGGLMKRDHPGQSTVNTIDVPDLDDYVKRAESAGGKVAVPKMAIPGIGWLAYCTDTEGNIFGMMQNDPEAK